MRALENIIRMSTDRLASRQSQGWLTPRKSRAIVIAVLAAGFALVVIWACALAWFVYRLIAFLLS
jgi:hypothetical protein